MSIFEKSKNDFKINFPEPPKDDVAPAFKEPKSNTNKKIGDLSPNLSYPTINENIPAPIMPTTITPTLYIKLSDYKNIVESTNKMRKDIEKVKSLMSNLRMLEKEENNTLEKSKELISDIDGIVSLFEKTMVSPLE